MVGRIIAAVSSLSTLLILVLLGYYVGWIRIPVFEKSLSELEVECVVAAIHSDARWAGDVDLAVRREIGRAVLRHARVYRRDVCDVFRLGLTLVPPGYKRFSWYFRTEEYVRRSLEATDASWKSDTQLVRELVKENGAKECATHYLRKERWSDMIAQPSGARDAMRSRMKSVGRAKDDTGQRVGTAEFFCS